MPQTSSHDGDMADPEERLLSESYEGFGETKLNRIPVKNSPRSQYLWHSKHALLFHVLLTCTYTVVFVTLTYGRKGACNECWNSPLRDLRVEYSVSTFESLNKSSYVGLPSSEIDGAWDNLLDPLNIQVSHVELSRWDQSSVRLDGNGRYLAWLGVFHELHCLNMLRKWNFRDYYHPNLPETSKEYIKLSSHADHCFEMLRQSLICHGDRSLTTFVWDPGHSKPMFDASETRHMCVDWDLLTSSLRSREISEDEMARLDNPVLERPTN